MKRKNYITPTVQTVKFSQRKQLLTSSFTGSLGTPQSAETEDWD